MSGRIAIFVRFALVVAALLSAIVCARFAVLHLKDGGMAWWGGWVATVLAWLLAWFAVGRMARVETTDALLRRALALAIPLVFGATLLFLWEVFSNQIPNNRVLLPPPSLIWERITSSLATLGVDFRQTFTAVVVGYALGCGSGFLVALLVDRVDFLRRGLLPVGNLLAALPIIGVAPIMVMWFGFDWPSKAAVVVVMTFFPMLVNTVAGLTQTQSMERDLLRTYAASPVQTLLKLRLPAAMPFVFNALKINSTLALIGAIVAEFFGSPISGIGFRINTSVGSLDLDMVWAEIAMAALAGSLFYALVAALERLVTFWHPSQRAGT